MNKKFYMVHVDCGESPTARYESRIEAEEEAQRLSEQLGKPAYVLEAIEEVVSKDISKTVTSLGEALEYLSEQVVPSIRLHEKHSKALNAIYSLIIIAEAWNKADDFVPDFDNKDQYKYFPWFYKEDAGFACSSSASEDEDAILGSRLCFKTSKRARQFGEQFIDLWNDFLLFR